jgi:predicted acyltransferase (DUF342 family)
MREERGQFQGDQTISEPIDFWGIISGDVTVIHGGKLYIRGAIYGDLRVEYGGRVHIYGSVSGKLTVEKGAKVIHSGVLGGDAINEGGRLFVDSSARVMGKIRQRSGETSVDPKAQINQ